MSERAESIGIKYVTVYVMVHVYVIQIESSIHPSILSREHLRK